MPAHTHSHRMKSCKLRRWLVEFASVFTIVFFLLLLYQMTQLSSYENVRLDKEMYTSKHSSNDKHDYLVEHSQAKQDERVSLPRISAREQIENSVSLKHLQKIIFAYQSRPPDSSYNINVTLSDTVSLDREIPDTRPPKCQELAYDLDTLPTASVIFPFYNEALSMLLRAVHSVLRRSPDQLLQDVILVDDASLHENLKEPLTAYTKHLPKVKLVRNKVRQGLIRSRIIGAELARGEVLIFLDAHNEVNIKWLEPILHEIWKNPRKVVQPNIDQVEPDTIEYTKGTGSVPRGSFSWDLRYVWMQMPSHEKRRLGGSKTEPFRTPTLVGCAMAVSKTYFDEIGSFDEGLNIWGGENIELGFRVWQCGGQVLTIPCSRVGHTFKPFSYNFDGDKEAIVARNLMRVAEMWMDDYKKYFYATIRIYSFKNVEFSQEQKRSLEHRKKLREDLKCRSFKWYMDSIVPELSVPPPEAYLYGEVRNSATSACFYVTQDGYVGLTYFCFIHRILPENMFHITKDGHLRFRDKCVHIVHTSLLLQVQTCDERIQNDRWTISGQHARGSLQVYSEKLQRQQYCVMQVTYKHGSHKGKQMVQLVKCNANNWFQIWQFTYRLDYKYVPKETN